MGKLIMCYDTETTGLSDYKAAYDAPHQPNVVQLGYRVWDIDTREVVFEIGHLVNSTSLPSWNGIEPGAQAIHGITEEAVRTHGLAVTSSMKAFQSWVDKCVLVFGHNESFDAKMMTCFAKRADFSPAVFEGRKNFCTMMSTVNICKVPNVGRGGYKWPKLTEAYEILINPAGFGNAHNALADVSATGEIFWHLMDKHGFGIKEDGSVHKPGTI